MLSTASGELTDEETVLSYSVCLRNITKLFYLNVESATLCYERITIFIAGNGWTASKNNFREHL